MKPRLHFWLGLHIVALGACAAMACEAGLEPAELTCGKPPDLGGSSTAGEALDQPDGLAPFNAQPWNAMTANRWNYLRRTSSKDDAIVADATAPFSPPSVLRIVFTRDMKRDHEPSVHFTGLPKAKEVYAVWWMKLSPNWTCSPAGCGKIAFLFSDEANGAGITYSNLAGADGSHYINIATTWPAHGYKFWEPNVATTPVYDDQWYRIAWYERWASGPDAADGIIRWWVNDVLNGDYRSVRFPLIPGFIEFQYAPTRQNPPPTEQYMYVDHTCISAS
jgi:hypothetical protein